MPVVVPVVRERELAVLAATVVAVTVVAALRQHLFRPIPDWMALAVVVAVAV